MGADAYPRLGDTHRCSRGERPEGQKKIWGQAVDRLCERDHYSVDTACRLLGRTRQSYYKHKRLEDDYINRLYPILDTVEQIRQMCPGIGGYKLWLMSKRIHPDGSIPGRDTFFSILRTFGLVQKRPKPRHTTNSNHRFHKYKNLIKGYVPTGPNRLWVSDITYIDMDKGCSYLHLVTDAYSRKIVGWCLSPTLEAKYTLSALQMAISQTGKDDLSGLIHHSDRGVQYCCNMYVSELERHNISISMTEDYKPTDNAIAERVNGIIKTEVIYREKRFRTIAQAGFRLEKFINFYNEQRPHSSIDMKSPSQVHEEYGLQNRRWKKIKSYPKRDSMLPENVST